MERDIAAHLVYQPLRDHQPQSGTAMAAGDAGVRLTEGLEQTRLIPFRNADTGIADLNLNLHLVITDGAFFYQDVDVAAFGEFNRISDKIGNDLLQAQRIANNVVRHVVFNIER